MAAAEAIADAQALQLQGYILTSITALLLYNWIVTIDDEVNQFRRRKITGASILFVAFRYIPMANYIMVLPFYSFSHELTKCTVEVVFTKFLDVSQYFLWAAFAGMRTWALLRRLDVALLIGFFSVTPFLVNLISLHWGKVIPDDPTFGCDIVFIGIPESVNKTFAVLARLPPVLADLTVLGITWSTQYHPYRMSQSTGQPARLITIMLRNGSIYFTVVTLMNLMQLVLTMTQMFGPTSSFTQGGSSLGYFINPLTAILVMHFLSDLRRAADIQANQQSLSSIDTLEFKVIGPISSTLPAPGEVAAFQFSDYDTDSSSEMSTPRGDGRNFA